MFSRVGFGIAWVFANKVYMVYINISKFLVIASIYLSMPLIFAFWAKSRGRNAIKELFEVALCMISMPIALTFFGNKDLHDFVSKVEWSNEDAYTGLKLWGYAVIFGIGGMRIIKKVYESFTGDTLDLSDIDNAIEHKVEKLEHTNTVKDIPVSVAASLLSKFNDGNSKFKTNDASKDELLLIKKLELLGTIKEVDHSYLLTSIGRRLLEAKATVTPTQSSQ